MDWKAISEDIRDVSDDNVKLSKAAFLRNVIDDVEAALAAGVPRSVIVDKLVSHGLDISLATFQTTLHRVRKKKGKPSVDQVRTNNQSVTKTIQPVNKPSVVELEDDSEPPLVVSHDPRDIDEIMRSTPDLEYYARIYRESKRNKKA
ncbi:MAG: hypothetical protein ACOYMG_15055 [Candidatus Methylumidiphilus sp.]